MSADILFGRHRMWSARQTGFNEFLLCIKECCNHDEIAIKEHLNHAEAVCCLGMDDIKDLELRKKLAQYVLDAATALLAKLQANSGTHPGEIEGVQKLVALSREYRNELRGDTGTTSG